MGKKLVVSPVAICYGVSKAELIVWSLIVMGALQSGVKASGGKAVVDEENKSA